MELINFVKPYRFRLAVGSTSKFIEAILELYLPILMAKILDVGIALGDKSYIIKISLQILLFAVLGFICATICQYTAAVVSQASAEKIRNSLIEKVSNFSYQQIDSFGASTLVNRLTTDINNYQQMLVMVMRMAVRGPAICLGAIIMSLLIDVKLSLIFLLLIPILAIIILMFMKYTSPLFKIASEKLENFSLIVRENLSGIRVVRAFAATKSEAKRASIAASETSDAYTYVGSIFAIMEPLNSIFLNCSIILVLFFGAKWIFMGRITQGEILSLTIYANKILYALLSIAKLVIIITKGSVSGKRISEILMINPTVIGDSKVIPIEKIDVPIVQINNLSFNYSDSSTLISNLSLSMEKGSTLGIVGVTGSGKTTLLDLIQGFYQPISGEVLLGGVDIKSFPNSVLRNKIGIVPQNNVLFSGTIAENLRIANKNATESEIISALKTAQCWSFVEKLPNGINTTIFEGGKNFSGGQKQRLTIARALIKIPELLLLDDSLSALDYTTDFNLRTSLKTDYPLLSTIIVSQRISSVIAADKIAVLDYGILVGLGTHKELLESCSNYQDIYKSQTDDMLINKETYDE